VENMNQQYQTIGSLSSGARERKTKEKGILFEQSTQ
jgi:hypothetical protein